MYCMLVFCINIISNDFYISIMRKRQVSNSISANTAEMFTSPAGMMKLLLPFADIQNS